MEQFQIYLKKEKKWSKRMNIEAGYEENWVLDKETDTATLRIYLNGIKSVKWRVMDWCRICNVPMVLSADETKCVPLSDWKAEYSDLGIPTNHTQYLIASIKTVYNESNDRLIVDLSLMEPIERTRGIMGETLNYLNQTEKKVNEGKDATGYEIIRTYRKARYNHYTALERWLKVTPANCDNYGADGEPTGVESRKSNISWFNRIKILDKNWLKSLPFEDDTFNELSLYNVLLDKYDSSTGRTPVMYFDIDPATDLPYNPARDEYILKFERQDGFDKKLVYFEESDIPAGVTGRAALYAGMKYDIVRTQEADNYLTGIVANLSNIASKQAINYPAQGFYAVPEVNQDVRGLKGFDQEGTDNWVLRLPHNIKRVTKVERVSVAAGEGERSYNTKRIVEDKTAKTFERQQYLAADPNNELKNQDNIPNPDFGDYYYWYDEGQNLIYLRDFYYQKPVNYPFSALFYVEYEPMIDARIEYGSTDFTQQINQTAAQVAIDKFSSFAKQYLAGSNKADLSFGRYFYEEDFNKFKDLIGSRVKRGDRMYMITAMSYKNRQHGYDVFFQLNQNHFRRNNSYRAPQRIRPDIAIPFSGMKDRYTCVKRVFRFGLKEPKAPPKSQNIFELVNYQLLFSSLVKVRPPYYLYPQVAVLTAESTAKSTSGVNYDIPPRLINIAQFQVADNMLAINMQMFDNADAGKQKIADIFEWAGQHDYKTPTTTPSAQEYKLYVDPFGEIDKLNIRVLGTQQEPLASINQTGAEDSTEYLKTVTAYKNALSLPEVPENFNDTAYDIMRLNDLQYKKDALETLNLTMIVEIEAKDNIIIAPALIANSRLIQQSNTNSSWYFCFCPRNKALNDTIKDYIKVVYTTGGEISGKEIEFTLPEAPPDDYTSIVIIDSILNEVFREPTKYVVINDVSDEIKEQIKTTGKLTFYFA